jgi:hypothetical protein
MPERTSLADDLLSGVEAISKHLYGDATPYHQRRVRHLVDRGLIPSKKMGGRVESRRSWIDEVYSLPDQINGNGG